MLTTRPDANMVQSHWDPEQYRQFSEERAQPFHDLLALVAAVPGGRVVDLGCGTGELTRVLHETSAAASTVGIDNAPTMLAKARTVAGLSFVESDIAEFTPRMPLDIVFSNAALQWLPNHDLLLARLATWVAPGGQIAIQMPANQHHVSHTLAASIAEKRFGLPVQRPSVLAPEEYSILLDQLGFARPAVRVQVYLHHLPSPEALVEWVEGTLLKAYRARLDESAFGEFSRDYRASLLAAVPPEQPYRFTFPRILIHACKRSG